MSPRARTAVARIVRRAFNRRLPRRGKHWPAWRRPRLWASSGRSTQSLRRSFTASSVRSFACSSRVVERTQSAIRPSLRSAKVSRPILDVWAVALVAARHRVRGERGLARSGPDLVAQEYASHVFVRQDVALFEQVGDEFVQVERA